MFYNPYSFIRSSNIKEKLYKGSNIIYNISSINYPFFFNLDKIEINYIFNNSFRNRAIFYSFLLLMEKLTLVRYKFIRMKKTIASFNTKQGLISGALYKMYSFKKDRFLHMFVNYSLKKLNTNIVFNFDYSSNSFLYTNTVNFGLRKFLFHGIFSSSDIDYQFFLPLIEHNIYGMNISFNFNMRYFLVNRLTLSHHSLTIY